MDPPSFAPVEIKWLKSGRLEVDGLRLAAVAGQRQEHPGPVAARLIGAGWAELSPDDPPPPADAAPNAT